MTILAAFIKASFDIPIAINEPKSGQKTQLETFLTPAISFYQEPVVTDDTNSVHSVKNSHLGKKRKIVISSYISFKDLIPNPFKIPYARTTGIYMGQ